MSLQFIVGRAGSGKSSRCLSKISKELESHPQGDSIIYLVPDQMTFQAEYSLVSQSQPQGMIRAQVFSFSRLALRIMQEVGGITRYHLNHVGLTMILRKIMEQRKEELKIFRRSSEQQGFYEKLEQMVTEFKRYCVTVEHMEDKSQELALGEEQDDAELSQPSSRILLDKLHDLHLIYADFQQHLAGKYIDSEDYLQLLVDKIPHSHYLKNAEIIVDGFYQFTPQELLVLQALIKHCARVKVSLTLDQVYDDTLPHELDLFYPTAKTYQQIKDIAEKDKVNIDSPVLLTKLARHREQPSLAHLEGNYDQRPATPYEGDSSITLAAGVNRRAEVEGVARRILHLIRDQDYRWRDTAILVRDMNLYHELLETVFEDYEIPLFLDQKRSMLHHSLIEFIRSSLDVINQNWRYEAVFRCVKTDLLFSWKQPSELHELREEMDQLENYVLAYGINGAHWTNKEPWKYYRQQSLEEDTVLQSEEDAQTQQHLNKLRQLIVQPLHRLQQNLNKASSVREMCEELFLFLEALNIPNKIESWRQQAEGEGDLRAVREHDQVWGAVIDLLDQLVEMMGEETLSLEMFIKLIDTGCESMRFSLVPPAMDQVLVGSVERSRFSAVKCAFVLGINDGVLPAKPQEDGLISEDEREALSRVGIDLAPGTNQQMSNEHFAIYVALNSASDQLWLSYALADEEGRSLTPSVLINRIKQIYPRLEEQLIVNDPFDQAEGDQLSYISNPRNTLSILATELRHWKKGYTIAPFWWDVYNWFARHESWNKRSRPVLSSLFYKNEAKRLSQLTSLELYGQHIQTSVSRMERFKSCPFSHFLSHGLRLKERKIYRLEALDIGQLFHAALKLIDDQLRLQKRDWRDLTIEECQRLAQEVVNQLAPRLLHNILLSSNRLHYIKYKLQQVVERATRVTSQHSKSSQFTPLGLEIDFGPKGTLPSISYTLKNGVTMEVIGRIDRVDQAQSSQGLLLRVIDYKSSQTVLNLTEVYYGLSLQMLTYLDVIITHAKKWLGEEASPAGVLYFHIHNPMLNKKTLLPQDQIDREIYRQFKMKGYVLADQEAVQLMDSTLETQHSDVIPVGLKKDGQFYSNSSVASEQDFDHLREYVRHQAQEIGTQMSEGSVEIRPYRLNKKIPCTFCQYKPVCQFDLELEENNFFNLPLARKDRVLEQIRYGGGQKDE